ncbi:uncharacterized protein LOC110720537 [Chenopodium quinoa]|uniref:uncharacterized protein LOC110720537 n=1 Tax=Chenopodium quinoa TaxID=63459 RepID=UPI000B78DBF7|nr:uncharacterized protein LOC110720537 [Chenopodium quinoa]
MGSEYTKSAKRRSSVNSPYRIDEKEKESIKAEIHVELQEQMQSQFNAILKHMNLPPLPFPSSTPVDSCSHPGGPEDDPVVEREDPSPMDAESLKRANPMPEPFPDVKEETPCELLHPGENTGGQLQLVGYGSAQPFDKVHFKSNTSTHYISVGIDSIVAGFKDLPLPVPKEEYDFFKLRDATRSFVQWPRDQLRLLWKFSPLKGRRWRSQNPRKKVLQRWNKDKC